MYLTYNQHQQLDSTHPSLASHKAHKSDIFRVTFHHQEQQLIKMSHCHDEHVGHGGHDHDHEHDHSDDITPAVQHSLYSQINFDHIVTLNEAQRDVGQAVVKKTWQERLSVEPELASDVDEQLLMTVP